MCNNQLDHIFDYLPYNGLSGQWQGIHIYPSSNENTISYVDIYDACNGLITDSADVVKQKLTMTDFTIHNCQGYSLLARHSKAYTNNSVFSNILSDCISINGGDVVMSGCILAQFYPFGSNRGVVLRLSLASSSLKRFACNNSLITGHSANEVMGNPEKNTARLHFAFEDYLLCMPREELADNVCFKNALYGDIKDMV